MRSPGRAGCSMRRACSRASRAERSRASPCASPASWRRGTSCSWSPTTAGSICQAASTRCRSRRSRTSTRRCGGRRLRAQGNPAHMNISAELLDELIEHVSGDPRNERCGVVAVEPGSPPRAVRVYPAVNIHESPLKFEIDPAELLELWNACQQEGCELGAIYHSHVRSE